MDQGIIGCPGEECADEVYVDDIRKGVAPLREPTDAIPQGLVGLLLAALEVPGVTRVDIRPLEISDEEPLEVRPVTDAVVWEEFKPRPNMFPHVDGEILNDEKVIIHPSGSAGEPKIFEPNTGVCLPSVLGNVGGRSEAQWEWCFPDTPVKGLWSRALRAGTLVIRPATVSGACFTSSLDGLAGIRGTYRCMVDIVITLGSMLVANGATGVLVQIGPLVYRW